MITKRIMTIPTSDQKASPPLAVVVDAQPADYVCLAPLVRAGRMDCRLVVSGAAALRIAPAVDAALWTINTELPDMSGFELMEMMRDNLVDPSIVLVGDRYEVEDEMRCRQAGATLYFCKPLQPSWFTACIAGSVPLVSVNSRNSTAFRFAEDVP